MFRAFNFRRSARGRKYFNDENFPIYGMSRVLHICHICTSHTSHMYFTYVTYVLHIRHICTSHTSHMYFTYVTYVLHICDVYFTYVTYVLHICHICTSHMSHVSLASYPGSWWAERKSLVSTVHTCNYLLLNTCLGKSGRGTRNTYPRD